MKKLKEGGYTTGGKVRLVYTGTTKVKIHNNGEGCGHHERCGEACWAREHARKTLHTLDFYRENWTEYTCHVRTDKEELKDITK